MRRPSQLEGIGAVLLGGTLLVAAALLAVPRASAPQLLPLPQPDRRLLRARHREEAEVAERARHERLSFKVRAVGEAFRRVGTGTVFERGVPQQAVHDLERLAKEAREEAGGRPLLALRGLQVELFVEAVHAWAPGSKPSKELRELGGDFPEVAKKNGWLAGDRLLLDDEELATLFRMRWTELTRTGEAPPLAATLDELRAFHALLLRHAPPGPDPAHDRMTLLSIAALQRLDPSYPAALARGVVLYRRGALAAAADAFRAELRARSDGPYRLRARNHLLAALAELPPE